MSGGGTSGGSGGGTGGGYDPKSVEGEIYALWESGGYFHAEADPGRTPFVITIPPPNVTGALHLGHALNNTLQDILVRRKRMQGFNTCWLPGMDHAGIATQAVVEKRVREEQGLTRQQLGREGLVAKINEWKDEYMARIRGQLKKMGCSCDWARERFTLDEGCVRAVYETFFRFFRDGLIYRGTRLVNWDTQLQTAVADDEVYHETVRGSLWHVRYPVARESDKETREQGNKDCENALPGDAKLGVDFLVVATTRPETMLADTAVAVHPDDPRYRHLIGKRVVLPLTGRTIPIIADGILVKREFGTGCVKVTPGHDPNDYACWQRKQGQPDAIEIRNMMTGDGRVHAENSGLPDPVASGSHAGSSESIGRPRAAEGGCPTLGRYAGLKLDEARKRVVADLEAAGLLEKVEPYETEVGHSDRSKTQIQPYLSEQWFLRMSALADGTMEPVRDGRVQFFPERFAKSYLDWLGEKRDWCISRQLWWGHRIPVWRSVDWAKSAFGQSADDRRFRELIATGLVVLHHDENRTAIIEAYVRQGVPAPDLFSATPNRSCHFCPHPSVIEEWSDLAAKYGLEQDPDVLDTWFSSALWPHSTFGWPEGACQPNRDRKGAGSSSSAAAEMQNPLPYGRASAGGVVCALEGQPRAAAPHGSAGGDDSSSGAMQNPLPYGRGSAGSAVHAPEGQPRAAAPHGSAGGADSLTDLQYFYPTSVLSTARDIITLWVARMVVTGLYNLNRVPFQHVLIHPTIQDGQGRRMSKSAGNGVDPLDLIELYGADAMRFTLASLAGETQDCRIPVKPMKLADGRVVNSSDRFELGRNLVNKLWQAANGFVMPTCRDVRIRMQNEECRMQNERAGMLFTSQPPAEMPLFEKWIRVKLLGCIREVDRRLDHYEFSAAADALRTFFWNDLCDWYIEEVKSHLRDAGAAEEEKNDVKIALLQVFDIVLCLFHPAVPFVTEAIWRRIGEEIPRHHELIWPDGEEPPAAAPALIVAPWPQADDARQPWLAEVAAQTDAEREVDEFIAVIRALREIRTHINAIRSGAKQPALKALPVATVRCDAASAARLREGEATIRRLGQVEKLDIRADAAKPAASMSKVIGGGLIVFVSIEGLCDVEVERKRLHKEREDVAGHKLRLEAKLSDDGFVGKAPPEFVEKERARLAELSAKLATIEQNLADVAG